MYSNNLDNNTLKAKARQSITVHNHDFEIVEAMKRRSTMRRNVLDVEAKKESYAKTASFADLATNTDTIDAEIAKAEQGKIVKSIEMPTICFNYMSNGV